MAPLGIRATAGKCSGAKLKTSALLEQIKVQWSAVWCQPKIAVYTPGGVGVVGTSRSELSYWYDSSEAMRLN